MTQVDTQRTVCINIDGQTLEVPEGMNVIDAAALLKKEIPHYCYHPKLSVAGNCRMCLVEIGFVMKDKQTNEVILDAESKPKIAWGPKPVIGCAAQVSPGMHIRTQSDLVKNCQEGVMEFLLANHPLDCPICDKAGECRLQEFASDYGRGSSRFIEEKNTKPKRTQIGPRVMLDDERCILCSRCIRFMQEIPKEDVLGFINRGSYSTLTCFPGKELNSNYSLNTVDICPVGALTSTDFRFKMRTWFLKRTPSICAESSVGVNTEVWSREGVVYRITPRRNDSVNDTWMSDSGRMLYKQVQSSNRIQLPLLAQSNADLDATLNHAAQVLKAPRVAYVVSGHNTFEEHHLLSFLIQSAKNQTYLPTHYQEGDGILISKDRTPNSRSAFINGLVQTLGTKNLIEQLQKGNLDALFVYNEDLTAQGITPSLLKNIPIVYLGTHHNYISQIAHVVIPTLTVFEKSGTFVNQQLRLQKFSQAVPGPAGTLPDYLLLNRLLKLLNRHTSSFDTLTDIWNSIKKQYVFLQDIDFSRIPEDGIVLKNITLDPKLILDSSALHYTQINQ